MTVYEAKNAVVSGWAMLLFGMFWLGMLVLDAVPKFMARNWVATSATVLSTTTFRSKGKSPAWCGAINYQYSVDGRVYKSHNVTQSHNVMPSDRAGLGCDRDQAKTLDTMAKFPDGSTIVIHYNPDDPGRAAMKLAGLEGVDIFLSAMFLLCVGGARHRIKTGSRILAAGPVAT